MSFALIEIQDAIGAITMNHVEKHNALSEALIHDLIAALDACRQQKVRVIILRAPKGAKVWSAGHDVTELPKGGRDPLGWSDPLRTLVRAIEEFPTPIIAMIEGGVWGGGCEVAFSCDLLVAATGATFAITPAKLGVPYNMTGVLNMMNVMSRAIVNELFYTAQPITAERAERVGAINYVVSAEQLESFTYTLARQITRNSPLAISVIKEELRMLASAYSLTPRIFERIQGLRRTVYDSQDYQEGIQAFLEKRPPLFRGE